ncbi:tumor necrosis factor receptor superfamily member 26-like isoform X2 [Kogia breviceps]|uniref:tumor necrosis factor receptor superfamily member 26-like isoform X2 n=1 Tax=Kogia breviceps TaxID=27615 RepID=UPI0034D1B81F
MVPRALAVLAVLQLLAAQMTMATRETRCNPGEYEVTSLFRCSKLCPAGYYVSKYIDQDHRIGECRECELGTFLAHPNEESSCMLCSQCREDQEVVTECSPTSDRLCQCKQGNFYCDSMDCTESCFRCKRCEDSTILQPCNATKDTVCAVQIHPEAGNLKWPWILLAVTVVLSIATAIVTTVICHCRKAAAWFFQSVVVLGKPENPKEPGSPWLGKGLSCRLLSPEEMTSFFSHQEAAGPRRCRYPWTLRGANQPLVWRPGRCRRWRTQPWRLRPGPARGPPRTLGKSLSYRSWGPKEVQQPQSRHYNRLKLPRPPGPQSKQRCPLPSTAWSSSQEDNLTLPTCAWLQKRRK